MWGQATKAEGDRLIDTTARPESAMGVVGGPAQGWANGYEHNRLLQTNSKSILAMRKVLTSPAVYVGADAWLALMQSPTWRVRPAGDDEFSRRLADHIRACLGIEQPPVLGIPWEVRLESLLSSALFGFGLWELVCREVDGVWYTDLQSRDQASITSFQVDASDRLVGYLQSPVAGWSSTASVLPAGRCLHLVHRPRGETDWCGTGMLRACEPEYQDRVALSQLAIAGAQRWAMPTPTATPDYQMTRDMGLTSEQVDAELLDVRTMLKGYTSSERAYMVLPPWIKLTPFGGDVQAPQALDTMISARDHRMLMVFLQQWLMLGSVGSGGSYSLGETQVKAGADHAAQTLRRLCRQMGSYIDRAIRWQFGDSVSRLQMPTLEFDGLNSETYVAQLAALSGLVQAGILTPDDGMEDDVRRALEFRAERTIDRPSEARMGK